MYFITEYINT